LWEIGGRVARSGRYERTTPSVEIFSVVAGEWYRPDVASVLVSVRMPSVLTSASASAIPDLQGSLSLSRLPLFDSPSSLSGVDLFAGIGGLSAGFAELGIPMVGVDSESAAALVYESAGFGLGRLADLRSELITADVSIVVGGPPCRPWSAVNQQRRTFHHADHGLLARFVDHVEAINPMLFVMENVPALRRDETYTNGMARLRVAGFDVAAQIVHYDHYGAATKRRRLLTVGIRAGDGSAQSFFDALRERRRPAATVRDAILKFRDLGRNEFPDHDWSELNTIHKYRDRYTSGQYGWRKLEYDQPAPSFGSVAKTYILHPEAGIEGFPERVLSVREVMAIMGFGDAVRFPEGMPRTKRYQMVANSVSPQVSRAIAAAVVAVLTRVG